MEGCLEQPPYNMPIRETSYTTTKGAWVATAANLNQTPATTNTNWNTFAEGGEDGAAGSCGL